MPAGRRSMTVPLMVIFALAFAIRMLPTAWSPYPYNIDGLAEASYANDIYLSGGLEPHPGSGYWDSYILEMPFFNCLLAELSLVSGVEPMAVAQALVALIGATSCVLIALLVVTITDNRRAGILAGIFLALLGTYVFCTASVWKESLGLTMMVIVAGLLLMKDDPRFRILLTASLLMMTFVHHHSAIVTYLFFTLAVAGGAFLDYRSRRWSWRNWADIATAVFLWVLAELYYGGIDLPYYDFITPDKDLYLLIALMGAMIVMLFYFLSMGTPKRIWIWARWGIPLAGLCLLLLNFVTPIFPGLPETQSGVLLFAGAFLLLCIPAWIGSEALVREGERANAILFASVLAPLTMIAFALLRGFDPTSHMIIYRTFDFLDLGLAVMFGVGASAMIFKLKKLAPMVVASMLIIVASTAPIAFQTEQLFGVQNQTYGFEIDALEIIGGHPDGYPIVSDQRIGTIANSMYNISWTGDMGPLIEGGGEVSGAEWMIVEDSWTSSGAQEFPLGRRVIDQTLFDQFVSEQNLVYLGGPASNKIMVLVEPS